ncbi:hypothetical protein Bhyg_17655, partial [Pseudolycoriella hygida]
SLPGAEETEPTTILEELNRNIIEPVVVAQVPGNDVNENERTHDVNNDNDQVSDVAECSQLTEEKSVDVTDKVCKDNEQIVHSDKPCDSYRNDGIEILNFNLQTIEDDQIDNKVDRAEITSEVKDIDEEDSKLGDNVSANLSDTKSDNFSSPSFDESAGKSLREISPSPPPVPLVTYRWEDVRRDKQKVRFEEGGYPWTYLDPHEPRVIVLNKNSEENAESKETEDIKSDECKGLEEIDLSFPEEETEFEEKVPEVDVEQKAKSSEAKKTRTIPNFLQRVLPNKKLDIQKANQSSSGTQLNSPTHTACCHPLVEKLKTMADKQLHKAKRTIRKHPLQDGEQVELKEPQQILKLKESPKAERKEFASYVVKQDSDDVLEIVNLDESPSETRRHREEERSTIVCPDEIIELPLSQEKSNDENKDVESIEPIVSETSESEVKKTPPPKSPRKPKEHVYEEIDTSENDPTIQEFISYLSLRTQDDKIADDKEEEVSNPHPLSPVESETNEEQKQTSNLQAPISSVESPTAEDEKKLVPLSDLQGEVDERVDEQKPEAKSEELKEPELKSLLKREASPSSDKKVTFSVSTDDNSEEPHREDVDLPEHIKLSSKWSKM